MPVTAPRVPSSPAAVAPPRAILFDRDGVLTFFDFGPVVALLREAGGVSFDDVRDRWFSWSAAAPPPRTVEAEGALLEGFWDAVCFAHGLSDDVRRRLRAFDYRTMLRAFADARPALLAARARGLRTAVLSNFPLASLDASLAAVGLDGLIDVACAASVIGASKPSPEAYAHALAALGVDAAACVFVDDEAACVAGARAVGLRAFLLDRRASTDADHDSAADDAGVVRDLGELLRHVLAEPA